MNKPQNIVDQDITDESYKGPSAAVTALGQGFFDHLKWAMIGLVSAGTAAFFAHEKAGAFIEWGREAAEGLKAVPRSNKAKWHEEFGLRLKNFAGNFLHLAVGEGPEAVHIRTSTPRHKQWVSELKMGREQGFGNQLASHTIGILPVIGKPFKKWLGKVDGRTANAVAVGGVAGLIGYIGGWIKAAIYGGDHARAGRNQFERAQEEILDQRVANDALRAKYVETKMALEDMRTAKAAENGTLHVAKDTPPAVAPVETGELVPTPEKINNIKSSSYVDALKATHTAGDWKDKIAAQQNQAQTTELA